MDLDIFPVAARPDRAPLLDRLAGAWPVFMYHDPLSALYYQGDRTRYAEFCLLALDPAEPDRPVAKACAAPFDWPHDPADRLPDRGYDAVLAAATATWLAGRPGNLLAAIEVAVRPDRRGQGISVRMLRAMRDNAARLGYRVLVAPVRPSAKHRYPDQPLDRYLADTRPDGLPTDPWLRVHVRAGGRIAGIAPTSMTIAAPLADWRAWTGLPFDRTGPVRVPEALAPVHCDVAAGYAVYVEPNVWVVHQT